MKLWMHQKACIEHFLSTAVRDARRGAMVLPTGTGKTLTLTVAIADALQRTKHVTGALVATSRIAIADAFAEDIRLTSPRRVIPPTFWSRTHDAETSSAALNGLMGGAVLTTHAQVVKWGANVLVPYAKGKLLVIDEGHHLGETATQLWDLADAWHAAGGHVWSATATPYRDDERRMLPPHVPVIEFSYSVLAARGLLPASFTFDVIESKVAGRVADVLADADYENIAADIVDSGRCTLLRVPPGVVVGGAVVMAAQFVEALVAAGMSRDRILDTTGMSDTVVAATRKALHEERAAARGAGYDARNIDVIITCQRLGEGADWPMCSQVVSVGTGTALVRAAQLIGRATRSKTRIANYPAQHVDNVRVVIFVPQVDTQDPKREHVKGLLLLACALEAMEAAVDYHRLWAYQVRNFRLPPRVRRDIVEDLLGVSGGSGIEDLALPAAIIAELSAVFPDGAKLRDVVRAFRQRAPEALEALVGLVGATVPRSDLEDALRQGLEEIAALPPEVDPATARKRYRDVMLDVLDRLAVQYAHHVVPLRTPRLLTGMRASVTAADFQTMALDMTKARDAEWKWAEAEDVVVARVILPFRAKFGQLPTLERGVQDISDLFGFRATLDDVDRALRRGGYDLARLCATYRTVQRPPLTPRDKASLKRYARQAARIRPEQWSTVGAILAATADKKFNVGDENLVHLEIAAQRGWRGLPRGTSLASWLTAA